MTIRELISQLECLERDMDDLRALPAVIQTESGTMEIKSVIVRPDYMSPYCRVVELSPRESVKKGNNQ